MFATLPSYSSSSIILQSKNGLFPTRTSKSQCSMSFTARNPSRVTTEAFAGTTSRVDSRKPANLYEVLRIKETASPTEIKTAYRCLAKQYHPDAAAASESESDGRDFIEIHNAYATLSDPTARARYDISIGAGRRFRYAAGNRPGIGHRTRRWETDQCW